MNIVKLRLRRLRTEQVREKAESCAVDLLGEEEEGGRGRGDRRERPEEEEESGLIKVSHVNPGGKR